VTEPRWLSEAGGELAAIFGQVDLVVFDFDGVMTDNAVWLDASGNELVRCWRSDGIGLARLKAVGVKPLIISMEANKVVTARADKLKVECLQGILDKAAALTEYAARHSIPLERAAYMGNDINDLAPMRIVGLPIAVADAVDEVLTSVRFRTRRPGGHGAVREVCDLIFAARSGKSRT
jgi:3-deoxy-D-manno-octulosonate 8-phosphate phosphatase (KDO 8-P phosphatase)